MEYSQPYNQQPQQALTQDNFQHLPPEYNIPQPAPQPAPQAVPVVNPNTATFIADVEVLGIIGSVHPELASAMINIAIKKFAEDKDFAAYFVKAEFKKQAEINSESRKDTPKETPPPAAATGSDFSQW